MKTVLHVGRQTESKAKRSDWENAYYLGSQEKDVRTPPSWINTIRGHWAGCEIRNHWRKDAILLEDKTRSRNARLVGNLILLRNLVLVFFEQHRETYPCLPAFVEAVAADHAFALRLIRS